jgi:tetratricopeptide (TPR) repeat protein
MKNVARMMETASAHHRAGKLADAERSYREILRIDQGHAGALGLLGALYIQIGQFDRATTTLEKALQANPANPETLNNLAAALQRQGRITEAIEHYRQALRVRPDYPEAHNNLGNLFLEQGQIAEAIAEFEEALRLRPHYPQAHYGYAQALHKLGKTDEAIAHYEEALRLQPNYLNALFQLGQTLREVGRIDEAVAHYEAAVRRESGNFRLLNNLGNFLHEQGKPEAAIARYQEALRIKPGYAEASINLGTVLRDLGRAEEAMASFEHALRLGPNDPETHINIGVALFCDFGRVDDALARYDHALSLKPDSADALWNKALALLAKGEYREGWKLYESGFHHKGKRSKPFTAKPWKGEIFTGKRLLICGEQGLGDHIQFVRFAQLCKERGSGKVALLCTAPLVRILKTNLYIDEVVTSATEADFDYQVAMMSLPHIFGTTLETIPAPIPYLSVTPDAAAKWAPRFKDADGFKIGLVWAGGPREAHAILAFVDGRRSMHLSRFAPLLDIKGARFYSLQLGKASAQIVELGLQDKIADFTGDIADFMDTAAIIKNLDLVISVDTSVVHLAGALGTPVWVLSRYDACWRWLQNRESNPWYPSARIFGQTAPGNWDSVINKVHKTLLTQLASQLST